MVSGAELPRISWEENFGPEEINRIADLIVATITGSLAPPAGGRQRLFFVVPTPTPYAKAEKELFAAAGEAGMEKDLRWVNLPNGGRCYAISGESQFRRLIPSTFRLGPPELTFIAANCEFDLATTAGEITDFVLSALRAESRAAMNDFVGMHFDSGDLVEMF
ncbi:MAG: hypothetical protein LUQ11_04365 [Methylococcaceae bacterium]|nr:hypothetical protein [Methylococcaceae bacterium]